MSGAAQVEANAHSRTFTWQDPALTSAVGMQLSGLAYMRAIASGELPAPPIARLLEFEIV